MLDGHPHRTAIEWLQFFAPSDGGYQPCVGRCRFGTPRQVIVEVDGNLEKLMKLEVELGEQIVQPAGTDEDDLDVQGHWLRCERHGRDKSKHLRRRLDPDLHSAERALQCVPGKWLLQQLVCIDQQITSVGTMEGSAPNQAEIGDERPHLGQMLDRAHEIHIGRTVFVDHRRAGNARAVNDDVDLIATKTIAVT